MHLFIIHFNRKHEVINKQSCGCVVQISKSILHYLLAFYKEPCMRYKKLFVLNKILQLLHVYKYAER